MGRTHTKKVEARAEKLKSLPRSERLLKSALIKKKEGRVLDASEKHAVKMSSEHGELLRLWEKLRTMEDPAKAEGKAEEEGDTVASKKAAYEHKYPVVDKLMHLIEPKFSTYVRTPSVSRVIQSMIKYGSPAQIEKLLKWISKDFATYATDAYAHFVVTALVRHAPHDVFEKLFTYLIPAVPQLVSHKFGIEVVHAAYSSRWCNSTDRNLLLLAIFKDNVAVMKRWAGYPVLEDVIQQNPTLQKRLLTRLFDLTDKLVSQKAAVGYPFVQRMAYAFIRYGTKDEVSELCDTLRPHLAEVALSREGAPLASLAFTLTEPKKRKEILRSFNDKLGELSTSKYSAPVIARLFDLLYDPQLLHKYVADDMVAHIGQVINSPYGYQILLHLLTPHKERKERFLLPNWFQHNLYAVENTNWNHHTWLTADYQPETVEICSRSAMNSHLTAAPIIVGGFLRYVQDEANASKVNRHHAALIAREVLHVNDAEPLFRAALHLTPATRQVLEALAPAEGKRPRDDDEDKEGKEAAVAKSGVTGKKKKKARLEQNASEKQKKATAVTVKPSNSSVGGKKTKKTATHHKSK